MVVDRMGGQPPCPIGADRQTEASEVDGCRQWVPRSPLALADFGLLTRVRRQGLESRTWGLRAVRGVGAQMEHLARSTAVLLIAVVPGPARSRRAGPGFTREVLGSVSENGSPDVRHLGRRHLLALAARMFVRPVAACGSQPSLRRCQPWGARISRTPQTTAGLVLTLPGDCSSCMTKPSFSVRSLRRAQVLVRADRQGGGWLPVKRLFEDAGWDRRGLLDVMILCPRWDSNPH